MAAEKTTTLEELKLQVDEAEAQARRLVDGLSDEQLVWQPHPGRWSIAHCLEHLTSAGNQYLDIIEKKIAAAPRLEGPGEPSRPGWFERWFILRPGADGEAVHEGAQEDRAGARRHSRRPSRRLLPAPGPPPPGLGFRRRRRRQPHHLPLPLPQAPEAARRSRLRGAHPTPIPPPPAGGAGWRRRTPFRQGSAVTGSQRACGAPAEWRGREAGPRRRGRRGPGGCSRSRRPTPAAPGRTPSGARARPR